MGRRSAKVPYRVLPTLRRQGNNSRAEERASRVYQMVRGAFVHSDARVLNLLLIYTIRDVGVDREERAEVCRV